MQFANKQLYRVHDIFSMIDDGILLKRQMSIVHCIFITLCIICKVSSITRCNKFLTTVLYELINVYIIIGYKYTYYEAKTWTASPRIGRNETQKSVPSLIFNYLNEQKLIITQYSSFLLPHYSNKKLTLAGYQFLHTLFLHLSFLLVKNIINN